MKTARLGKQLESAISVLAHEYLISENELWRILAEAAVVTSPAASAVFRGEATIEEYRRGGRRNLALVSTASLESRRRSRAPTKCDACGYHGDGHYLGCTQLPKIFDPDPAA